MADLCNLILQLEDIYNDPDRCFRERKEARIILDKIMSGKIVYDTDLQW